MTTLKAPHPRAALSGMLLGCVLGTFACAPAEAQTRASCSQWPAAERQAARERGLCVDRPLCTELPRSERSVARQTGACVDPVLPKDLPTTILPRPLQPIPGIVVEPKPPKDDVGTVLIPIPGFIGQQQSVAHATLAVKLRMRVVTRWQASIRPRGEVLDQVPRDRRVPPASTITLTVSDGSLVRVPRVQGLPLSAGLDVLRRSSLEAEHVTQESSAPTGSIIAQAPMAESEVKRGSTVRMTVATAPPSVWVPNFIGTPLARARRELTGARLQVQVQRRTAGAPADQVVDQLPRETHVPVGSTVTLGVSDGSLVRVPVVTRMPLDRARAVLRERELVAAVEEQESSASPGNVVSQRPSPGAEVRRGSSVAIAVATAPPPVWVPSFIGKPVETARAALRDELRLKTQVQVFGSSAPRGVVVEQAPIETRVAAGSTVTLQVSDGSLVRVPELATLSEAAALTMLHQLGLEGEVSRQTNRAPPGTVFGQDVAAGTDVPRGSTVSVYVALQPPAPPPPQPPSPPAPKPPPTKPATPPIAKPTIPSAPSPWWWTLAAIPVAGAAAWWLRARPNPKPKGKFATKPDVTAHFVGPVEPPQAASYEGPPLHMQIDVSGPHPSARPIADIMQESRNE